MNNLRELLKNASLEDLQSLLQEKKVELKKVELKNDFMKKVTEMRNFCKEKNLSLDEFLKFKSFFKKSKNTSSKEISKSKQEKSELLKNKDAIKKGIDAKFFELLKNGYESYLDDSGNDKIKVKVIEIEKIGLKDKSNKKMFKVNAKLDDGIELKNCYMYEKNFNIFKSGMNFDFDYYAYFR